MERSPDKIMCPARTKKGGPCPNPAGLGTGHPGQGPCMFHEPRPAPSKSERPDEPAADLYRGGLLKDEADLFHRLPLGSLDQEIKMLRLQLRRAFQAQARAGKTRRKKDEPRRDFHAEICRLTKLIADLEARRQGLAADKGGPDQAGLVGQALREIDESIAGEDSDRQVDEA